MAKNDMLEGGMAQTLKSPTAQQNGEKQNKAKGAIFGLLAVLTAVLIMAAVIGGAFYIIIHNNINGLAERYRKDLQGIPVVSLALPKSADPEDPKYLTPEQITEKYQELRKTRDEMQKQIDDAKKQIEELQKSKVEQEKVQAESDQVKKDAEAQAAQLDAQKKQLDADRKKVNELIASGNKADFKTYFEKVDKDTAAKIYAQIVQEQKVSDDTKKFVQIYESMDGKAAAKIFEQMGTSKIDMVVDILKNMKKETAAEILAAMDPAFSSKVTDKLSKAFTTNTGSTK